MVDRDNCELHAGLGGLGKDAHPKPDDDNHRSGRVPRAESRGPVGTQDLMQQAHGGLEWQAARSAEPC